MRSLVGMLSTSYALLYISCHQRTVWRYIPFLQCGPCYTNGIKPLSTATVLIIHFHKSKKHVVVYFLNWFFFWATCRNYIAKFKKKEYESESGRKNIFARYKNSMCSFFFICYVHIFAVFISSHLAALYCWKNLEVFWVRAH